MKTKLLLLFSGGYDSAVLLYFAIALKYDVVCLSFFYGQKNAKELDYAKKICEKLNVLIYTKVIDFSDIDSALTGDNEPNKYPEYSPHYVPSRNLVFLSHAIALAENLQIPLIWYGGNYSDTIDGFPDCSQKWVVKFNEFLQENNGGKVTVQAPLLGLTKTQVIEIAEKLNIKKKEVYSGY